MTAGSWALCGIAAVVAVINAVTMRRLWATEIFERPQKIMQTILLWVIPGSFLAIRHVLGERLPGRSTGSFDSTVYSDGETIVDSGDVVRSHHVSDHVVDTAGGGGADFGGGDGSGGGGGD